MKKVLLVLALFAIGAAHGAAGKAVFVSGSVTAEGPRPRALATGAEVDVGDTIITAAKSRAQLAMNDGQRYALRAGSSFRIDAFSLPAAVSSGAQATAVAADGQSFFTLQKGGFRSVSGAIGKKDPAAYQVRTPVGTLGIRGTIWAAVFCRDDCDDAPGLAPGQPIRNGLYIGVDQGRIHFAGRGLELELNAGEYAFIPLDEVPIERLKQPPVFLLGDGAGPLEVAGNGPRTPAQPFSKATDFSGRRSPLPERAPADPAPPAATSDQVNQPVSAQGPRGATVDLTKGGNPPQRSLAFAFGGGQAPLVNAGSTLSSVMLFDANGNLIGFATPSGSLQNYAIGSAQQASPGVNVATGIRWGRWTAGNATVTTQGGAPQTLNLAQQSLPWIVGPEYLGAPTLPTTGSGYLTLAGNTTPTDTRGNAGSLGGASFLVDFTRQIFNFAVLATIDGRSYYAANGGVFVPGSREFSASLQGVVVGNIAAVAGAYAGFIVVPGAAGPASLGAAVAWYIDPQVASIGNVSGATVFSAAGSGFPAGGGNALTPPAQQRRDISFSMANLPSPVATSNAATDYVRSGFNLTGFRGVFAPRAGSVPLSGQFDIGGASTADAGFDLRGMLRWGRWAGGAGTVTTPPGSGNAVPLDFSQQSLHYIMSADSANAPLLPNTGSATYTWIGNTSPTNQQNQAGTLNSATFAANFTNATVAASINASFANSTWSGAGNGTITGGTNLFSGNLNGTFTDTQAGFSLPAGGSFNGFFTGPQDPAGVPNGVGLSFEMTEQQTQSSVNGVAAFVARP
jgi:hypothetical protein